MTKRTISALLAVLCIMSLSTAALAVGIGPLWLGTSYIVHGVDIDALGKAYVDVDFYCYDGYRADVTVTLQKVSTSGSVWSDVKSWTASGSGCITVYETYKVTQGVYRVKTVGKVYNSNTGAYVETATVYSNGAGY